MKTKKQAISWLQRNLQYDGDEYRKYLYHYESCGHAFGRYLGYSDGEHLKLFQDYFIQIAHEVSGIRLRDAKEIAKWTFGDNDYLEVDVLKQNLTYTEKLQILVDELNKDPKRFMDGKYLDFEIINENKVGCFYYYKVKNMSSMLRRDDFTLDSRSFVVICYEYLFNRSDLSSFNLDGLKALYATNEEILDDILSLIKS